MTLRGVDFIASITLVAELGDLRRFAHPKQLMAFLGLVPSEYTTGESRRQGAITKCGNAHVRRILIESAWSYRYPARLSRELTVRAEGQPQVRPRNRLACATAAVSPVPAPPGARPAPKSHLRGNRP